MVLKGKYKTVDEAEDDLGITVESYQLGLDAANKTVDHQPAHVPSHLLSSILRQRFHRFDVGLPPVPQGQQLF